MNKYHATLMKSYLFETRMEVRDYECDIAISTIPSILVTAFSVPSA